MDENTYNTFTNSKVDKPPTNPNEKKEFRIIVTPKMVRKVGVIKPGDIIQISIGFPVMKDKFCFVSYYENQWIELFKGYKKKDYTYFAITKIEMMS